MSRRDADLAVERSLCVDGLVLAGMDEVGRGALAGPVCVGAVAVLDLARPVPTGMTDSKLLTPRMRESLREQIMPWADAWAVGEASAGEIDEFGIIGALRLAGRRAIAQIVASGFVVGRVLLDGSHDWLTVPTAQTPQLELMLDLSGDESDVGVGARAGAGAGAVTASGVPSVAAALTARTAMSTPAVAVTDDPPVTEQTYVVTTRVKADVTSATVAAASILAKCHRDAYMTDLASQYPEFAWDRNKGYASAVHREALAEYGPTVHHRTSWKLPALNRPVDGP